MWKNVVTDDNIIQPIHNACWITKATDTHSEYVLLFHGKKSLRERASMLRYTYSTLPVVLIGDVLINIIIIFINCNWVVTRWQWLSYMYTKHESGYYYYYCYG